jgi:hypothetical protein
MAPMRLTLAIAPLFALGAIAGAAATEVDYIRDTGPRATVFMPYCGTEDGSDYPNRYCLWVDPDTGRGYVNDYTAGATVGRGTG